MQKQNTGDERQQTDTLPGFALQNAVCAGIFQQSDSSFKEVIVQTSQTRLWHSATLPSMPDQEVLKRDLILDKLKPSLREQEILTIPRTIEQVIANATFMKDKVASVKAWAQ